MAEFLWTFAVEEVLKTIVKYGVEQVVVAWGMEKDASELKKQLQSAAAILADINNKKSYNDSLRLWVEQLQDIVYEADDLLDQLLYEHLRRTAEQTEKFKKVRDSLSLSKNSFLFRRRMAKKMKNITYTLYKHHCAATASFGLVGVESAPEKEVALKQIRETTSILDFKVEGREAEIKELLKLVIDSSNDHDTSVISIVGMGGLGKTTLAKIIFNHDTIKQHFDTTIWVCVSKPFIITKILEHIFQGLMKTSSGLESNKDALLQKLRTKMQDKKYFLVLDDVWEEEIKVLWDELRNHLKYISGKSGNTIMVTTRSVDVANVVEAFPIHYLQKLSNDQCWALFKESANANKLPKNSKLEILKDELLRKMGGVPLVAKVLGGAVKFEEDEFDEGDYESWMTKVKSISKNISTEDKDFVLSILKLSVDSLPLPTLKQCFAYCSNFPQDYKFRKDELIQMWIAQGFIQPQQERENLMMEDIGEEYFNFLLARSLFQDVNKDENGRMVDFKMHDLIHDIACMVSNHREKESSPNNLSGKSVRKLRTLVCKDITFDCKVLDDCVDGLRVLKREDNDLWIPVDKLIHLRYLDIFTYPLEEKLRYRESLYVLYNLQTLKLGYMCRDLPTNLRKLVNLRHLEFDIKFNYIKQMPTHMGRLIHLQTLSAFVVGLEKGRKLEELGSLKNIKGTLTLKNLQKVRNKEEAMTAKLVEKKNLRHLTFEFEVYSLIEEIYDDEDDYMQVLEGLQPHKNLQSLNIKGFVGKVLPNSIFVDNIVEIRLDDCKKCEVLPMLGQLSNLKKLEILRMKRVRSIGNEFYGIDSNHRSCFAFPKLEVLSIEDLEKLEQWDEVEVVESNLFGCLKRLQISYCDQLSKLPGGLKGFHSIEYLVIRECPNLMELNLQNMQNLYRLDITSFKGFPEGLDELSNLKELVISGYNMKNYEFSFFKTSFAQWVKLELFNYGSSTDDATIIQLLQQLQHLTDLKSIEFSGWMQDCKFKFFIDLPSQLVQLKLSDSVSSTQLPPQLQHLTNLNRLIIDGFQSIEVLPEWLGNLTRLRILKLYNCEKLKELPSRSDMLHLTKLEHFYVFNCPKLLVREGTPGGQG